MIGQLRRWHGWRSALHSLSQIDGTCLNRVAWTEIYDKRKGHFNSQSREPKDSDEGETENASSRKPLWRSPRMRRRLERQRALNASRKEVREQTEQQNTRESDTDEEILKMYLALGGAAKASTIEQELDVAIAEDRDVSSQTSNERNSDKKIIRGFYKMEDIISVEEVVELLHQMRFSDVCWLDLRKVDSYADFMILGTGYSPNQIRRVGGALIQELKRKVKRMGKKVRIPESLINANRAHAGDEWVSVDMGDTFLQVMSERMRKELGFEAFVDNDDSLVKRFDNPVTLRNMPLPILE